LAKKNFDNFILEKLADNWGKVKGGKISPGRTKDIKLPEISKNLAEFYGIMLGDGNLNKTKGYKLGTYSVRIVGDKRFDSDYLILYVKPLIEQLFNIKVRAGIFKNTNAMFIEAHSLKLVEFLERLGFIPGNKIKNKLRIPTWIFYDISLLRVCLRGLFDTDGTIFRMSNQDPNLLRIGFSNANSLLIKDVTRGLSSFGFKWHISKNNRNVYISRKNDVERYLNEIGFKNKKHLDRIKMFRAP
jgi:intein/homing endonuclease